MQDWRGCGHHDSATQQWRDLVKGLSAGRNFLDSTDGPCCLISTRGEHSQDSLRPLYWLLHQKQAHWRQGEKFPWSSSSFFHCSSSAFCWQGPTQSQQAAGKCLQCPAPALKAQHSTDGLGFTQTGSWETPFTHFWIYMKQPIHCFHSMTCSYLPINEDVLTCSPKWGATVPQITGFLTGNINYFAVQSQSH